MKPWLMPCLWFDQEAEAAVDFYVSVFPDSRIRAIDRYPETGQDITGGTPGAVASIEFEVNGQPMTALNGGPSFKPNEAVSLMVLCETQDEVDEIWAKLTADGGAESQCGWLKDKYGFAWQILPEKANQLFRSGDQASVERVWAAMLKMQKLDLAALERAAAGK